MRFRLRTLLLVLALGPPLIAGAWALLSPFLGNARLVNTAIVCAMSSAVGFAAVLVLLALAGAMGMIDGKL
jgi:hypothetical protein